MTSTYQFSTLITVCRIAAAWVVSGLMLVAIGSSSAIGCTISANTGSSGLITDSALAWSGCGTSGYGVQGALNQISVSGGGTLQLTGAGGVLVTQPLTVYGGTAVSGDSSVGTYGTPIVGEAYRNSAGSCAYVGSYRDSTCPLFVVTSQSGVTLKYLDVQGDNAGRLLDVAFQVQNSTAVTLSNTRVVGARFIAFELYQDSYSTVSNSYIEMRSGGTDQPAGAGIWSLAGSNIQVTSNTITAPQFYSAGPPAGNTMDLVAFYGGTNNTIDHNSISYSNTAGIYLALNGASGETNPTIWANSVDHFQQHGLDLANCTSPQVLTNTVSNTVQASLSLYACTNGTIEYNEFSDSFVSGFAITDGAVWIDGGSTGNAIVNNYIYGTVLPGSGLPGGSPNYDVMFGSAYDLPGTPAPTGNSVTGNYMWKGTTGYIGGSTAGNTTTPNGLYNASIAAPVLQTAVSRKVHGSAGTFDLPLSLTSRTNPSTEPRQSSSATIVMTFNTSLDSAASAITEGTATIASTTISGNTVSVSLTGVSDQQYVTIALTNVTTTGGSAFGSGSVRIGFLYCDVNQNRVVSLADVGLINGQLAQPVSTSNYLDDVNVSGTITVSDKGAANAALTHALPSP